MTDDDFKKLYFSNDNDSEQKRKVLFEMASIYRNLYENECRFIDYRTTWFLALNGFLFTAFGIILAYYKGSHCFLISISLVFAALGCVFAFYIYRRGMNSAGKAIFHIHTRWLNFLETFFGYPLSATELNTNYYVPPISGLVKGEFFLDIQKHKKAGDFTRNKRLVYVMAGAWIILFSVVLIFNVIPCLSQSVSGCPTCESPSDAASSVNVDYAPPR